jgi:protein TonB
MTRPNAATHAVLTLAFAAAGAAAQPPPRESETYVEPKVVTRINPRYPARALANGREGWATMSFVVSRSGEVVEAMIEESSGDEQIAQAALDALLKWRYEPARRNGEPVEQAMTKVTIVLQLDGATGARAAFRKRYSEIVEQMEAQNLAAAAASIDEIEAEGRFNLYEDAWFWFLKALYMSVSKSPDLDARAQALSRAVSRGVYLNPELHVTATQQLYAVHAQRGEFGAAIETFERLRDLKAVRTADNYDAALTAMRPSYDKMLETVHGQSLLTRQAEIGEHDYWVGNLLRRSFTLVDVMGRVDVVDIRCGRGTARFDFTKHDEVWTVPESWMSCGIYIKGQPGTTFTFLEYPLGYSAEATSAVSQPSESP